MMFLSHVRILHRRLAADLKREMAAWKTGFPNSEEY
jgi:hypothetical protein